ncbi:MAG: family efflux transporter [Bacteroidetes bacterium]|nr:family efflux transporter [Bacteroidota bacterium]
MPLKYLKKTYSGYHKPGGQKELLMLALPMIISTACDGVMTFTDRLFLAKVGSEQMNASLAGGTVFQMLTFFFIGLIGYTTALTAQYMGAGEYHNSSRTTFQGILIVLIAWPVIALVRPLMAPLFAWLNTPASQINYQIQYISILAWGSIFPLARHTLSCYFVGIGRTKIVMVATIAAMLTNVVLDYIFIFGKLGLPPMGISGAAIATVTGSVVATFILLAAYLGKENNTRFSVSKSFRFSAEIMKKLIYFGSPAGFELFLNFIAFFFMVALFQSQGDVASTAATIMFNWDMVSFIPLLGVETSVTSLVGRYMGGGRPQVAHRAALSGIKTGILYSIIILILFVFIPKALVLVFQPEVPTEAFNKAVPIAVNMIRIASLYVLAEAVMVALVGALRGAGDTHFTMIASIVAHWSFVPVLYVCLNVLHLSVPIAWFILVVFYLLFCTVFIKRFNSGKWKKIRVIS